MLNIKQIVTRNACNRYRANYAIYLRGIILVVLSSLHLYTAESNALQLDGNQLVFDEIIPLFNIRKTTSLVSPASYKKINPASPIIPSDAKLKKDISQLSVDAFIGEKVFKDILITSPDLDVDTNIYFNSPYGIKIIPRIVTAWYQAGITTSKYKMGGALTYELLLTDDTENEFDDKWIKSKNGGWVYKSPDIQLNDYLTTVLSRIGKRVLLRFEIEPDIKPGLYTATMMLKVSPTTSNGTLSIPIKINVKPYKLINDDQISQKRILFTAFLLDGDKQRQGAYINSMRLSGAHNENERLLSQYYSDIRAHGFNGVTIRDYAPAYLDKNLEILSAAGFDDVILHASTPVNNKNKQKEFPIVNEKVRNVYKSRNIDLLFYGYDEAGGNRRIKDQLLLNTNIHALDGKSVNEIFWSDMPELVQNTGSDTSKCIDIIAHSLGSHGNVDMFRGLPFERRKDYCPDNDTKYLVYWHPHVENPVINRMLMGFWLWASGFDGVIPHGYYFPSHIEKILSKSDRQRGESNASSPYNDWSYWLPGEVLRHHNSVYPSSNGPIGTLQWEGVLSGYMDLKYVLSLESKLEKDNIDELTRDKIKTLLDEIRNEVLKIDSPYLSDKDSLRYLEKLEDWKKSISGLLSQ